MTLSALTAKILLVTLLSASDLDIAARTVWGEARGEPFEGQKAVAHVLLNRWRSNVGQFKGDDTLATACLRNQQFSIWMKDDPNFAKIHQVGWDDAHLRQSMRAVLEAIDESDPLSGATHYHSVSIRPYWAKGHEPIKRVGRHLFYAGVK